MGSRDQPLKRFDLRSMQFRDLPPVSEKVAQVFNEPVWDVEMTSTGDLFVAGEGGLAIWKSDVDEPDLLKELENDDQAFTSIHENEGDIWLTTSSDGVFKWNNQTLVITKFQHEEGNDSSPASNDVHALLVDSRGDVWFGFHNLGISIVHKSPWNYTFTSPSEYSDPDNPVNRIVRIVEDEEQNLWLLTDIGLVFKSSGQSTYRTYAPDLEGNESFNGFGMAIINEDVLFLVERLGNRIYTFDLKTKKFTLRSEGLPVVMTFFYAQSDSYYMVGTRNGELLLIDKVNYAIQNIKMPLEEGYDYENVFVGVYQDAGGNYIVRNAYAEYNFKFKSYWFDPNTISFQEINIELPDYLGADIPAHSMKDPGVVWSRTGRGILYMNYQSLEAKILFQDFQDVLTGGGGTLLEDNRGYLWISNLTGVLRLDPRTESIKHFEINPVYLPDNLQFPVQLENGDIVFGGNSGYLRFNPDSLGSEEQLKHVYITEISSDEKQFKTMFYPSPEPINFEYTDNDLSFSYVGLNYRNTSTQYRYKVEGYNDDWVDVGTQRKIYLANLPPGEYSFQVEAATSQDGIFNSSRRRSYFLVFYHRGTSPGGPIPVMACSSYL